MSMGLMEDKVGSVCWFKEDGAPGFRSFRDDGVFLLVIDGSATGVLLLMAFPSVVGTGWNFGERVAVNVGALLVMAFPSAVVGAG